MKDSILQDIAHELDGAAPPALATLDAKALRQLAEALRHARKAQRTQMSAATESSLQHVPFLLRGAVKKVLGIK